MEVPLCRKNSWSTNNHQNVATSTKINANSSSNHKVITRTLLQVLQAMDAMGFDGTEQGEIISAVGQFFWWWWWWSSLFWWAFANHHYLGKPFWGIRCCLAASFQSDQMMVTWTTRWRQSYISATSPLSKQATRLLLPSSSSALCCAIIILGNCAIIIIVIVVVPTCSTSALWYHIYWAKQHSIGHRSSSHRWTW